MIFETRELLGWVVEVGWKVRSSDPLSVRSPRHCSPWCDNLSHSDLGVDDLGSDITRS